MALLRDILSSGSGVSSMRLMSLSAMIAGIVMAVVGLFLRVDLFGLSALCGVFVGAAFTGKVMQKRVETSKDE